MTTPSDDAAQAREDAFFSQLVSQVIDRIAEGRATDFDAETSRTRFYTWLTAHTKELSNRGQTAIQMVGAKVASGESICETTKPLGAGPTVQRLVLGGHLRRLREEAFITTEQAAYAIRGSQSKISRMEHGRVAFKERDLVDLLTLYGVQPGDEREALLRMAHEANAPGWWQAYSDILPHWVEPYLGLEAAASFIYSYESWLIPGLLQTEGYARAVAGFGDAPAGEEIVRRVEMLLYRQEVLNRKNPPRLWVVVDEGALRRPIGGRDVMREQLRHLLDMCSHPAVTLQILPFAAGGHLAKGGSFTILGFAEPDLRDVVYMEQMTSALYLDRPTESERYVEVFEQICLLADSSWETPDLLKALFEEF
jgi:hypothetical protein